MIRHTNFVHLHVHTEYSLLDGACRIQKLVEKAHSLKMPALAITDHGNLFGAIEFYCAAQEAGVKPIIGYEAYVAPGKREEKSSPRDSGKPFHLTILAKDETGYKNLLKLATSAYLEGFYYKPRIDKELLAAHSEGLICLSGCMKSELSISILRGNIEKAEKIASEYKEIFGDGNFYLELQDNGIPEQKEIIDSLLEMGKKMDIPFAATNDCHYLERADAKVQDALLCIQTGTVIDEPKRMKFSTDQFYFRTPKEMKQLFSFCPSAISNTIAITEKCNLELDFGKSRLPHFDVPEGETTDSFLEKLCWRGSKTLFGEDNSEVKARLSHELNVIKEMGFSGYFLIVWDVIQYAKKKDITVGPGRGSVGGSLVAYTLGITKVNPLRFGLLFERFLNSERANLPDIDIDFCDRRRGEIIEYVTKKYGKECVAQIITFGRMAAKAVVRDVGRVLGIPYGEVDKIAKLIPTEPDITLKGAKAKEKQLETLIADDERVKRLFEIAESLEGITRHASTHAAGIVISRESITHYAPLFKSNKGEITTQYSMEYVRKVGLMKMDFLGLKTLTVMEDTVKNIKEYRKKIIKLDELPMDDAATYKLLRLGGTMGVFQLESPGMRDLLKKLEPTRFEEIIAAVALYRPGPLGSGMVSDFVKRKHNPEHIKYDHPALESILKETYGVILYQEQIMGIVNTLAGFSLEEADLLQKSISKKNSEVMDNQRDTFIDRAGSRGVKKQVAERVFDLVSYFAGYGFNKAHSTAYAMVAYKTAYLKANFMIEYMCALLTSEMGKPDKLVEYIKECRSLGIEVLPPDINESSEFFTIAGESIRFGLAAVKNVGVSAMSSIIKVRKNEGEFKSLHNFCENSDLRLVNRRVIESLIKCGAFDSFGVTRSSLMAAVEDALASAQMRQKGKTIGQASLFDGLDMQDSGFRDIADIQEWEPPELLAFEKEMLGFYISGHPLDSYKKLVETYTNATTSSLSELNAGAEVRLIGVITGIKNVTTRNGKRMAYVELEDFDGRCELISFPDTLEKFSHLLRKNDTVYISGRIDRWQEKSKVRIANILPISEIEKKAVCKMHIHLGTTQLAEDVFLDIKKVCAAHFGDCPVYLHLQQGEGGEETVLLANSDMLIKPSGELKTQLEELVGEGVVTYSG